VPFTVTADTTEATRADDDPDCVGGDGFTVWYDLTLAATTEVVLDTFGSDYDTTLSAFTGDRGALELVACNDDSQSLQSRIAFTAQAGVTYHLMVGAFPDSPGGSLVLTGSVLPPAVALGVTLAPTGSVNRAGAAVLRGTVTCSRPVGLAVTGTLRQQQSGGRVAVGSYRVTVACSGSTAWSATVLGETRVFRSGPAAAVAVAEFNDAARQETVRARAARTVTLT
jgi:hypothetical protein